MKFIVKTKATKWVKCTSCKEQIRTCEPIVQVQRSGEPVRGETYCESCGSLARENNPSALFKVEGDSRWFASTEYGPRAGWEHTGIRCEDYPCCGCCD